MIDNRKKAPDAFMPLWIADYLADTPHLTCEQHGAYLLLLMAYWRRQGPLPADDARLAAIVHVSPQKWRTMRPVLAEFFAVDAEHWHSKRSDQELQRAARFKENKAAAGRKGAENRWQGHGKAIYVPPHSVANKSGADRYTDPKAQEQSASEAEEQKTAASSHSRDGIAMRVPMANGIANDGSSPSPLLEPSSEKIDRKDSLVVRTEREPTHRPASKPILSKAERGTRWPSGQLVPGEWIAAAAHKRAERGLPIIDLGLEAEKFSNFWAAKAGRDATKVDWSATWRNWALNAYGAKANGRSNGTGQHGRAGEAGDVFLEGYLNARAARLERETPRH